MGGYYEQQIELASPSRPASRRQVKGKITDYCCSLSLQTRISAARLITLFWILRAQGDMEIDMSPTY